MLRWLKGERIHMKTINIGIVAYVDADKTTTTEKKDILGTLHSIF